MAEELMLKVEDVYKKYRLGTIGGGTLTADLQSWWARVRHKEDPNSKIGAKTYGKNEVFYALNGISFEVKKGEALGIIGGNGAGKSTTLKLISQVTAPTKGKIYLNGRITSMLEVGTGFHPELTGRENIYLNGAILGMTKAEIDSKIEEIIDFSECRQFIDTPVKRYSSGMYVKLAFSVAAHLDSEVMIMDEVLAVGDMKFQQKCINKMKQISKEEGRTILYVSHNMNTIRQLCDRCVVLDKGKVVFEGNVEEGIGIYLGVNRADKPVKYYLKDAERPYDFHGKKIHITEFEFLDKENAVFERTEKIRFRLKFDAMDDIEGLKMYFSINTVNGVPIGTTQTFEPICNTKNGKSYEFDFQLDISNIIPGEYCFNADLFSTDSLGTYLSYDHPNPIIVFKVIDSLKKGIEFQRRYTGSIMLNNIERLSD